MNNKIVPFVVTFALALNACAPKNSSPTVPTIKEGANIETLLDTAPEEIPDWLLDDTNPGPVTNFKQVGGNDQLVSLEPELRRSYKAISVSIPGVDQYISVVQQPFGNSSYVSNQPDALTQYFSAFDNSTMGIGLLAHDYLEGVKFEKVGLGDLILVTTDNGEVHTFIVEEILLYHALSPNSTTSYFREILPDGRELSEVSHHEVYQRVYKSSGDVFELAFQSCFDGTNGRRFVLARRISVRRLQMDYKW